MTNAPTFLFAGGGTGGHLFPGIAVAEELRRMLPSAQMLFAGSNRDVERNIVSAAGFEHVSLSSPPSTLLKMRPLRFVRDYWRACRCAAKLISKEQPATVIGLGGFASVPLVTAAKKQRIPIVLLEQNAVAGRATSRLSKHANVVCHTFAAAVPRDRRGTNCVVTGNPVRREIVELVGSCAGGVSSPHEWHRLNVARDPRSSQSEAVGCSGQSHVSLRGRHAPGTPSAKPHLLILGGSQGSTAVNRAMELAAGQLQTQLRDWRIVHQCGPNDREHLMARYADLNLNSEVKPFFDDMPARYSNADLVVSRAGATTLTELACAGLPAVLVPYPNAVRDHQMRNAEVFANAGAAVIVEQQKYETATGVELAQTLAELLTEREIRQRMSAGMRSLAKPDAATRVAEIVLRTAGFSRPVGCEVPQRPPHFEPRSAGNERQLPAIR